MGNKIKIRKVKNEIRFYFKKKFFGCAYREVDGFYVFVFHVHSGSWSAWVLKEVAEILIALNAEYNDSINEYMKENPPFDNERQARF